MAKPTIKLTFTETTDPQLIEQYVAVRAEAFGIDYKDELAYKDGRDEYDTHSVYIVGQNDKGEIKAGRRFIIQTPGKNDLPVIENSGIDIAAMHSHLNLDAMKIAEMGGLAFAPEVRSGFNFSNMNAINRKSMEVAARHNIDLIIVRSVAPNAAITTRSFERMTREGNPVNFVVRTDVDIPKLAYSQDNANNPETVIITVSTKDIELLPSGIEQEDLMQQFKAKVKAHRQQGKGKDRLNRVRAARPETQVTAIEQEQKATGKKLG